MFVQPMHLQIQWLLETSNVRRSDSLDPRLKKPKEISRDENGIKAYLLSSLLN